jgi:Transposase DDE domain group 1
VQKKVITLFGGRKVLLRGTDRPVTPFGGLSVFFEFLGCIGYAKMIKRSMPVELRSPNAIDPAHTFTAFLVSVLAGARRFAHAGLIRADRALHRMLGISRAPTDDTIRNLFARFGMAQVQRFYSALWGWQLERLPEREDGYSLDLDSTVFERYGKQEGAARGFNPRKHGRPSHHPLLAVLAEAHFVLHGWLRSGNCGASRGVVEFLREALALLGKNHRLRLVRADAGFFDDQFLGFLEGWGLSYVVVGRMTKRLRYMAAGIKDWQTVDPTYAVGAFPAQLLGWDRERRFIVVREQIREEKRSVGRKLLDVPGYTFRVFVTNTQEDPEVIWRNYNQRADVEKRIAELKYDLAADDFCMRKFFATESAFRAILMLFNLLGEFQRASGMRSYRQPATLRTQVFLCGAILGRAGHHPVIHLSNSWGGLRTRISLLDHIFSYVFPTSPKLENECTP